MADVEQMAFSMGPKFEAKGLVVSDLQTILVRRQATFNQLWNSRLSGQIPEIPTLEDVLRETNRALQKYLGALHFS